MTKSPAGRFSAEQLKELETSGCFLWKTVRYPDGRARELYVRKSELEERAAVDMSVIRLVKRAHILTLHGEGTTFFPPRTISQGLMRAIVSFIEERQEGIDEQTAASPPQPQSLL